MVGNRTQEMESDQRPCPLLKGNFRVLIAPSEPRTNPNFPPSPNRKPLMNHPEKKMGVDAQ
jgi:hypothetical protein